MALRLAAVVAVLAVAAGVSVAFVRSSGTDARPVPALRGQFRPVTYATSGVATIRDGELVLSHFRTFSSPELYVQFVGPEHGHSTTIAPLKSAAGYQRYSLPSGLDLRPGSEIVVWCKLCHIPWGYARLRSA